MSRKRKESFLELTLDFFFLGIHDKENTIFLLWLLGQNFLFQNHCHSIRTLTSDVILDFRPMFSFFLLERLHGTLTEKMSRDAILKCLLKASNSRVWRRPTKREKEMNCCRSWVTVGNKHIIKENIKVKHFSSRLFRECSCLRIQSASRMTYWIELSRVVQFLKC
jgi:hypothetical protein